MKPALVLMLLLGGAAAYAAGVPAPVTFTTEQDHQNMMDQLHIKTLRPGGPPRLFLPVSHARCDPAARPRYGCG